MTPSLTILLTSVLLTAGDDHLDANPVYCYLRETGIAIHDDFDQPLPPPTMADGLDPKTQEAVIKEIAGRSYPVSLFVRKSVVAPHVLRMNVIDTADQDVPGRGVDFWFVAYGDLETVADKEFLDQLLAAGQKDKQQDDEGADLTEDDLAKRGITIDSENSELESYAHAVFTLIQRVRLRMTAHSFWSQTSDSIVAATRLDPRFRDDQEFPICWRRITRNDHGKKELGPPSPYSEAGMYAKITRLRWPQGALFVECHVVFAEPHGWFDGRNLLASKLPPVVQSRVRSARRQLMKAAR